MRYDKDSHGTSSTEGYSQILLCLRSGTLLNIDPGGLCHFEDFSTQEFFDGRK